MRAERRRLRRGDPRGLAEGGEEDHALGAGAAARLLPAAVEQLGQLGTRSDVKRADALGRAELVPYYREEVDAERVDVHIQLANRLRGVGVDEEGRARDAAHRGGDLRQGLHRAHLVVRVHHRHQHRLVAHRRRDRLGRHTALAIDRHVRRLQPSRALKRLEAFDDGWVLNVRRDHMR